MYKWKPASWIKWAPVMAGLPWLASAYIATPDLLTDVQSAATKAANGAKIEFDARDATLSGEMASAEDKAATLKAVEQVYGVRRVIDKLTVAEPVKLNPPTMTSLTINKAQPEIKGTWPEGAATSLAVTLAGKTYALGTDKQLISASGNWTLTPAEPLADGTYDVAVEITDGKKAKESAEFKGGLVIDSTAPAAISISAPQANAKWPFAITGTWAEGDAKSLAVTLQDKTYTFGKDAELQSDGKGNFTFAPKIDLPPGTYDLAFSQSDGLGNRAEQNFKSAIIIPEPTKPAAPPPPALVPPTINTVTALDNPIVISGTWDSKTAKSVSLAVAGKSFDMANGITANPDGTWSLSLPPLPDGTYDVVVTAADGTGGTITDSTKDEVVIDTALPIAATVKTIESPAGSPLQISGTFDSAQTKTLDVSIPSANLVASAADVKIDSNSWSFTVPAALSPGVYDVVVKSTDSQGRSQLDSTVNEITILAPPVKQEAKPETKTPEVKQEVAKAEEPKKAEPTPQPAPTPEIVLPTVDRVTSDKPTAKLSGTWPAGQARALTVSVAGQTFKLGTAPYDLLSDASGKWTLNLSKNIKNGVYDVVVNAIFDDETIAKDATVGELEIAVPPPPEVKAEAKPAEPAMLPLQAPTVDVVTSDTATPVLTGTWGPGVAKSLQVTVNTVTYELGKPPYKLFSTADGKWKLTIDQPLPNGTYDVKATVTDGGTASLSDASSDELTVNVPAPEPEPAPKPVVQAYDCEAALQKIANVFPIRFDFARTRLISPYDSALNQYVAFLKDPRCAALKVEISGHADYRGRIAYNQWLSEMRATKIWEMLAAAGIDGARMAKVGHSELQPLDPAKTDAARSRNRRVEFHVMR